MVMGLCDVGELVGLAGWGFRFVGIGCVCVCVACVARARRHGCIREALRRIWTTLV